MGKAKGVTSDVVSAPAKGKSVKPNKLTQEIDAQVAKEVERFRDLAQPVPSPIPLLLRTVKLLDMTIEQLWGGRLSQDFKALSTLRTDVKQLRNELEGMAP